MNKFNNLAGNEIYIHKSDLSKKSSNIKDVIILSDKKINVSSVLSILTKGYTFDTQTTIEGVNCSPWMTDTQTNITDLSRHQKHVLSYDEISNELKKRLLNEASKFLEGKKRVGILLTGGMDSRVVAGIIRELQIRGEYKGEIVALTWGLKNSRDVIYSKRIAGKFGWEHIHFDLTPEILKENIILAGERGALYSPVHLHAMKAVSELQNIDAVLAGSYGDSIGRAEYSGVRAENLPDILKVDLNSFGFMLKDAQKDAMKELRSVLKIARDKFPGRGEQEYREIEMQMHYMRRELHSCMQVINEKIPLYQMFTDPEVFGFMWSLDYQCRTDDVYEHLLQKLPGDLLEIPWARTGKKYNQDKATVEDNLLKTHHRYGDWLRNDLRDFVIEKIMNGNLQKIGIFNSRALKMWCKEWKTDNNPNADRLDWQMAWLASLSIFIEKYDIQSDKTYKYSIKDAIEEIKAKYYYVAYSLARKLLRK